MYTKEEQFCFTCKEQKIAKRYFQIKTSWLTAIILKPHDNPSMGNKTTTPRAARLHKANTFQQKIILTKVEFLTPVCSYASSGKFNSDSIQFKNLIHLVTGSTILICISIGYHMSGEVLSVLSLEGWDHIWSQVSAANEGQNMISSQER